jgi:hypothetical protein
MIDLRKLIISSHSCGLEAPGLFYQMALEACLGIPAAETEDPSLDESLQLSAADHHVWHMIPGKDITMMGLGMMEFLTTLAIRKYQGHQLRSQRLYSHQLRQVVIMVHAAARSSVRLQLQLLLSSRSDPLLGIRDYLEILYGCLLWLLQLWVSYSCSKESRLVVLHKFFPS